MLDNTEGNMSGRDSASACRSGVVEDPGMCGRSLHGNREVSGFGRRMDVAGPHREGEEPKPMMHGPEKILWASG